MNDKLEYSLTKNKILGEVLFSESEIKKRTIELGSEITKDYTGKDLLVISEIGRAHV